MKAITLIRQLGEVILAIAIAPLFMG